MSEYIRRDDAVSRISDLLVFELKMTRCPTWNEVYNAIGELPSADVVQVVRCKDCERCEYDAVFEQAFGQYWCRLKRLVKPDGFCDLGKRREE